MVMPIGLGLTALRLDEDEQNSRPLNDGVRGIADANGYC